MDGRTVECRHGDIPEGDAERAVVRRHERFGTHRLARHARQRPALFGQGERVDHVLRIGRKFREFVAVGADREKVGPVEIVTVGLVIGRRLFQVGDHRSDDFGVGTPCVEIGLRRQIEIVEATRIGGRHLHVAGRFGLFVRNGELAGEGPGAELGLRDRRRGDPFGCHTVGIGVIVGVGSESGDRLFAGGACRKEHVQHLGERLSSQVGLPLYVLDVAADIVDLGRIAVEKRLLDHHRDIARGIVRRRPRHYGTASVDTRHPNVEGEFRRFGRRLQEGHHFLLSTLIGQRDVGDAYLALARIERKADPAGNGVIERMHPRIGRRSGDSLALDRIFDLVFEPRRSAFGRNRKGRRCDRLRKFDNGRRRLGRCGIVGVAVAATAGKKRRSGEQKSQKTFHRQNGFCVAVKRGFPKRPSPCHG